MCQKRSHYKITARVYQTFTKFSEFQWLLIQFVPIYMQPFSAKRNDLSGIALFLVFDPCCGKTAQKQSKICDFSKLAQNPPKSAKRTKQTCSTPFWGDVGIEKWSRFFCFGARSAIFWHLKTGNFSKSARFQVPKNGTSGAETKKKRPLFNANIPPK